ncbi:MAG: hypothetical protein WC783_00415 [Candidatus Paceibacterota bacterium]|jgi:hypothetical protein
MVDRVGNAAFFGGLAFCFTLQNPLGFFLMFICFGICVICDDVKEGKVKFTMEFIDILTCVAVFGFILVGLGYVAWYYSYISV